jgi:sortase A
MPGKWSKSASVAGPAISVRRSSKLKPRRGDGRGIAVRSKERAIGNALMTLGLGILFFLTVAFSYSELEGWLDGQQRYVAIAAADDWPLRPIASMLSPTPLQPPPSPTATRLPATAVPTPDDLPDLLPASRPRQAVTVEATPVVTMPIRIVIPKIKVNSRIVEVAPLKDNSWGTAAWAVAYHKGTGLLGEADNMVLSGHNNYQGEVFRRLSELKAGDIVKLYSADHEYLYKVVETAIIPWVGASLEDRRRHTQYLLPTSEPVLTLVSCWPYWVYTHRVYIVAKPAS